MSAQFLDILPEVESALQNKTPVVALESTIISHGMPFPQNLETAKQVEKTIRDNGAVPATIAIIDGKLKTGLNQKELEHLARADDVEKVSRRDIPYILSKRQSGATTVAATRGWPTAWW